MPSIAVRDLRPSDVPAAAALLAAAQRRALESAPASLRIGERYLDVAPCRSVIEQLIASPRASAVVAERSGALCGFLAGERQLFAPEDFASIYAEPRSTNVPLHGHAVVPGPEAWRIHEELYAALAAPWIADGFFVHNVAISALDAAGADAWGHLGFGRKSVCAVRAVSRPADAPRGASGVTIEEVRGRDDEVLEAFHRRLMEFQTGSPMFWPYTGESDARVRSVRRDALTSGQGFAYIARDRAGTPLGSLLFVPSVFLSPLLVCERMVYLWEGFVEETRRRSGVGTLLLDHATQCLAERGIRWCALHYVSGNPGGGRFWPARGFSPVEYVMHRHVDERIAWAKGPRA
ncbi:MAG TPA: GNAT family N-acetyltransferase [Candidatus Binatia bacterium]|jgi:GNAT superfamily N-acetyltransferase